MIAMRALYLWLSVGLLLPNPSAADSSELLPFTRRITSLTQHVPDLISAMVQTLKGNANVIKDLMEALNGPKSKTCCTMGTCPPNGGPSINIKDSTEGLWNLEKAVSKIRDTLSDEYGIDDSLTPIEEEFNKDGVQHFWKNYALYLTNEVAGDVKENIVNIGFSATLDRNEDVIQSLLNVTQSTESRTSYSSALLKSISSMIKLYDILSLKKNFTPRQKDIYKYLKTSLHEGEPPN